MLHIGSSLGGIQGLQLQFIIYSIIIYFWKGNKGQNTRKSVTQSSIRILLHTEPPDCGTLFPCSLLRVSSKTPLKLQIIAMISLQSDDGNYFK